MKQYAIKEHHLYDKTYAKGTRACGRYVTLFVLKDYHAKVLMRANPTKEYYNRVGLSVTKKLGNAVKRNRAKRLIRTAYQQVEREGLVAHGYLVVILAKDTVLSVTSRDVYEDMVRLLPKSGLLPAVKNNPAPTQ